jgi:hypothetical protein
MLLDEVFFFFLVQYLMKFLFKGKMEFSGVEKKLGGVGGEFFQLIYFV